MGVCVFNIKNMIYFKNLQNPNKTILLKTKIPTKINTKKHPEKLKTLSIIFKSKAKSFTIKNKKACSN